MNNIASLRARLKGWPHESAPFKLGGWGLPINIVALLFGGVMILNLLWFGGLRNATTNFPLSSGFPGLANVPVLNNFPILEALLIVLFGIGAIYWYGFKRKQTVAEERAAVTAGAGVPGELKAD